MVSLFSSLNIASGALKVNESAISVVSHNVANMNTEGYSKQRVNLASRNIAGAIGNNVEAQIRSNGGVMIANVMRYNNEYLNTYYRDQVSDLGKYEQQLSNLGDLADIFDDLDGNGISGALSAFYDALNNLQQYPASAAARTNFLESSKTLASILHTKSAQLDELNAKALGDGTSEDSLKNSKIYVQYSQFNDKLEELAAINKALISTQTGTLEANNLLDKRDLVLNEIAEFSDIHVEEKHNGSVDLYIGDTPMVKAATVVGKLEIQTAQQFKDKCDEQGIPYPDGFILPDGSFRENAVISITGESNVFYGNEVITGGALGGLLHSADLDADDFNAGIAKSHLNDIAAAVADIFNTLNKRDNAYHINPNDTTKLSNKDETGASDMKDIFSTSDGSAVFTAANLEVNPDLLTDKGIWYISCAYFDDPNNFDENAVGNAQNTIQELDLRHEHLNGQELYPGYNLPDLDGMSIEDYYTSMIGKIAASGSNAQNLVDTQKDVVASIDAQIKANNSVDLNEELVDLVKYQTAYAAAAQVFNVVNSCLDTLMNLGR